MNKLLLLITLLILCGCSQKAEKRTSVDDTRLSISDQLISLGYDYMNLSSKMNGYSECAYSAKSKKESILYLDSVSYLYENTCSELDSIATKCFSILDSIITETNNDGVKKAKDIQLLRKGISKIYTDNHVFKLEIERGEIKLDSWKQK